MCVVCVQDGQQVGQGHTLHLKDATYETTGEYICEVTVPSLPALHTSGTVHIIVQGQLSHQPPRHLVVTCHVKLTDKRLYRIKTIVSVPFKNLPVKEDKCPGGLLM